MKEIGMWLAENWYLALTAVVMVVMAVVLVSSFVKLPTKEQIAKIKEWLLYAVTEAEKELGGGTGQHNVHHGSSISGGGTYLDTVPFQFLDYFDYTGNRSRIFFQGGEQVFLEFFVYGYHIFLSPVAVIVLFELLRHTW